MNGAKTSTKSIQIVHHNQLDPSAWGESTIGGPTLLAPANQRPASGIEIYEISWPSDSSGRTPRGATVHGRTIGSMKDGIVYDDNGEELGSYRMLKPEMKDGVLFQKIALVVGSSSSKDEPR